MYFSKAFPNINLNSFIKSNSIYTDRELRKVHFEIYTVKKYRAKCSDIQPFFIDNNY